jgi:hypothetical protein
VAAGRDLRWISDQANRENAMGEERLNVLALISRNGNLVEFLRCSLCEKLPLFGPKLHN